MFNEFYFSFKKFIVFIYYVFVCDIFLLVFLIFDYGYWVVFLLYIEELLIILKMYGSFFIV